MAKTYHSFGGLAAAAAAAGVLVAVGMLLLTIVVMVEPAGAAFPGKNGKIAFQCGAEICTMNPNGQAVDTLTNNSVGDFAPAWSPGGGGQLRERPRRRQRRDLHHERRRPGVTASPTILRSTLLPPGLRTAIR